MAGDRVACEQALSTPAAGELPDLLALLDVCAWPGGGTAVP